jgi:hypothetical protein
MREAGGVVARRVLAATLLAVVAATSFAAGRGATTLALWNTSASVTGNTFTTGTWSVATTYYLHNRPTPPTGNTTAQANLSMTVVVPTAGTLYNYDSNYNNTAGRRLQRSGSGAGDTRLNYMTNWLSPAFATAHAMNGQVVLDFWSGVGANFRLNAEGVIVAYLRDYNPGTGTYTEIANATLTDADWQHGVRDWVRKQLSIGVSGYVVPAGHQLELKLETAAAADANMQEAYDAAAYPSSLTVP